jgi:hypothetical protein
MITAEPSQTTNNLDSDYHVTQEWIHKWSTFASLVSNLRVNEDDIKNFQQVKRTQYILSYLIQFNKVYWAYSICQEQL